MEDSIGHNASDVVEIAQFVQEFDKEGCRDPRKSGR